MSVPIDEAAWQGQVLDLAHALGWRTMHVRRSIGKGRRWTTATSVVGWPDLVLWSERHKRVVFVELKSESGLLSADQVEVLESLRAAGQQAYVWRPSDLDEAHRVLACRAGPIGLQTEGERP